ncbi:hypothetical protein AVEN_46223-1 [Araneus ventricosus]|uniref:Uncharacterized protein n=1 Tax=Araneus ventricosus TaxID=182803 RepID=A0A4Y2J7M0_ARAVE|nr:hypothetical protein AVEN_46223-1 [Araneus ventricosus]
MRTTFPNVAQDCDRASVSDRSAEILINAALKDMGMINKDDSSKVVYCSKIRRKKVDRFKLQAVVCDGTVINKTSKNGTIRQLELSMGHPQQLLVRYMRMNCHYVICCII